MNARKKFENLLKSLDENIMIVAGESVARSGVWLARNDIV